MELWIGREKLCSRIKTNCTSLKYYSKDHPYSKLRETPSRGNTPEYFRSAIPKTTYAERVKHEDELSEILRSCLHYDDED